MQHPYHKLWDVQVDEVRRQTICLSRDRSLQAWSIHITMMGCACGRRMQVGCLSEYIVVIKDACMQPPHAGRLFVLSYVTSLPVASMHMTNDRMCMWMKYAGRLC